MKPATAVITSSIAFAAIGLLAAVCNQHFIGTPYFGGEQSFALERFLFFLSPLGGAAVGFSIGSLATSLHRNEQQPVDTQSMN